MVSLIIIIQAVIDLTPYLFFHSIIEEANYVGFELLGPTFYMRVKAK